MSRIQIAIVMWLMIFLICRVAFACGVHDETGNDTFEIKVCTDVTPYCIVGDENIPCDDVPLFELTEEDLHAQSKTPEEQWAGVERWRKE